MAASTITLLSNSLRRIYSNRYFKTFQNDFTPVLNWFQECPDEPTRGVGWYFPFPLASPQNKRVNSEGGSIGTTQQRTDIQGVVNAVEFLGWFQLSEMLKNAGTRDASWNGGELNRHMKECTRDLTKFMQRMFVISHGTGRLALVNAATAASTAWVGKLDEGVSCLEKNDLLDFYDSDSGGTIQVTANKVEKINRQTRAVTMADAASLTENWGAYISGDYGRGSNGLLGLVDDGDHADNLHGQSRATYEDLKAKVIDPGTPTDLSEQTMRQICDYIYLDGGEVDSILTGVGGMNAYLDIVTGDRRYAVQGSTPKYRLGYKQDDLLFSYDRGDIVLKKDPNIPARTMFFLSKAGFMKHTLRKLGWLDEGGSILRLTPNGSDGFNTSWTALMLAQVNISCIQPPWQGVLRNIKDKTVAGDS
jgi:hypothetical protein